MFGVRFCYVETLQMEWRCEMTPMCFFCSSSSQRKKRVGELDGAVTGISGTLMEIERRKERESGDRDALYWLWGRCHDVRLYAINGKCPNIFKHLAAAEELPMFENGKCMRDSQRSFYRVMTPCNFKTGWVLLKLGSYLDFWDHKFAPWTPPSRLEFFHLFSSFLKRHFHEA